MKLKESIEIRLKYLKNGTPVFALTNLQHYLLAKNHTLYPDKG